MLTAVLNKINHRNTAAACNLLNARIAQVDALVNSGILAAEQASTFIDAANALKTDLGCV